MKRIRLILIISAMFFFATSYGQNEKFKALFMLNFTKYIEWPAAQRQGDFVIGVLGNSTMMPELNLIAAKQKVGSQKIEVKIYQSIDEIDNCHIIFVPASRSMQLSQVLAKMTGKRILVITEKTGLCLQGAGINFILDGDKVKFEINKVSIEKRGLIVSNSLLTLGVAVKN